MTTPRPELVLDLVDPLSWLLEREVRRVEADTDASVLRRPVELRAPPAPLTDPADPFWAPRWDEADAIAEQPLDRPRLVPWSRKAHELVLHAQEKGPDNDLVGPILDAFFVEGRDIGRVDVLVEIAVAAGLEMTETKAVLDVDRFEAEAALAADRHKASGTRVPALVVGDRHLQGFHEQGAIRTFLGYP